MSQLDLSNETITLKELFEIMESIRSYENDLEIDEIKALVKKHVTIRCSTFEKC